jgi:ribosomal protein S18 acetylase RimI-like enzyme
VTGAHGESSGLARPDIIEQWLATLRRWGYDGVRTGAVGPVVADELAASGFATVQDLALLSCDLTSRPAVPRDRGIVRVRTHSARRETMTAAVLDVDSRSFGPRWALDRPALREAHAATRRARLMASLSDNGQPTGFVLAGATSGNGFVQRLAVDPDRRREGTATRLLGQAHKWLSARGCSTSVVNTETSNEAALALYRSFGYAPLPYGLRVLERPLGDQ